MLGALGRTLDLREGEGRTLLVLATFLFLTQSVFVLLEAGKNSLFLSVFPPRLIPHAMVAAALLTAAVAVVFTGVLGRFRRRTLALGLTVLLAGSLVLCWMAFRAEPRTAFGIYVWGSVAQVLIVTHAWDYMSDLLTGRQAKRLMPLVGIGGSVAAVVAGFGVGPLALGLGAESLLWISGALLLAALSFLWMVREPAYEPPADDGDEGDGAIRSFVRSSGRGFRSLAAHPLLRLLVFGVVMLMIMSTLVDFQWKYQLQQRFERDQIAVAFGLLAAAVGGGTLLLQLLASRILFPRLGVSASAVLHAGIMSIVAVALALLGVFWVLALLQLLDDSLRESIEKPMEQISLLPFPTRIKNAAFTTLSGVVRPLSTAAGALLALALVSTPALLPWVTAALGSVVVVTYLGHRTRYREALEEALSNHTVDFREFGDKRLVVDRTAIDVVERGLTDEDPTVVVFALSLLRALPPQDAAERAMPLLQHPAAEVRAEAAAVLGLLPEDPKRVIRPQLVERLAAEEDPDVLARILVALGTLGHEDPAYHLRRFIEHSAPEVRQAALATLALREPEEVREHLERMLHEGTTGDRQAALTVVGRLRDLRFLPAVTAAVADDTVRAAALDALGSFGPAALPALDQLVQRDDLPFPIKRSLVTTLAGIDDPGARARLLQLVMHPRLGPAALTSLKRLRTAGRMDPLEPGSLRPVLRSEVARGARYALVGAALRDMEGKAAKAAKPADRSGPDPVAFVGAEMEELRIRSTYRMLAILTLGYDARGMGRVEANLFSTDVSRRSNALEFLEVSLRPEDAALALPLAEFQPGEPLTGLQALVGEGSWIRHHPLETLDAEEDWWPRALSAFAGGREIPPRGSAGDGGASASSQSDAMIPLIEKVMLLKGSDLFRNFPGDELAGIAELTTEVYLEPGETVFEQGDRGDAYYLVVRGGIRIIRDGQELAVLGSREGFGEMAILDQETRSATARAADATMLLRIDRDSFDQLVERNPAVARGIYRVLTQRLRSTLARIAAGS